MNLLQFSQIPRYKLVRQNAENGWGRSTAYTDLIADDRGEWMRVSDVRNLVVGDSQRLDAAAMVEALEYVVAYDESVEDGDANLMIHYADMMKKVRAALAGHRKGEDV